VPASLRTPLARSCSAYHILGTGSQVTVSIGYSLSHGLTILVVHLWSSLRFYSSQSVRVARTSVKSILPFQLSPPLGCALRTIHSFVGICIDNIEAIVRLSKLSQDMNFNCCLDDGTLLLLRWSLNHAWQAIICSMVLLREDSCSPVNCVIQIQLYHHSCRCARHASRGLQGVLAGIPSPAFDLTYHVGLALLQCNVSASAPAPQCDSDDLSTG